MSIKTTTKKLNNGFSNPVTINNPQVNAANKSYMMKLTVRFFALEVITSINAGIGEH